MDEVIFEYFSAILIVNSKFAFNTENVFDSLRDGVEALLTDFYVELRVVERIRTVLYQVDLDFVSYMLPDYKFKHCEGHRENNLRVSTYWNSKTNRMRNLDLELYYKQFVFLFFYLFHQ